VESSENEKNGYTNREIMEELRIKVKSKHE
jgi:hypothetical protein